jgi:hypothetical protein
VLLPRVVVVDGGVDAARRGNRVRPHRVDLRDDGHAGAGRGRRERRSLAGEACSEDEDVVGADAA